MLGFGGFWVRFGGSPGVVSGVIVFVGVACRAGAGDPQSSRLRLGDVRDLFCVRASGRGSRCLHARCVAAGHGLTEFTGHGIITSLLFRDGGVSVAASLSTLLVMVVSICCHRAHCPHLRSCGRG